MMWGRPASASLFSTTEIIMLSPKKERLAEAGGLHSLRIWYQGDVFKEKTISNGNRWFPLALRFIQVSQSPVAQNSMGQKLAMKFTMKSILNRPAAQKTKEATWTAKRQKEANRQHMRSWVKQHPRLGGVKRTGSLKFIQGSWSLLCALHIGIAILLTTRSLESSAK